MINRLSAFPAFSPRFANSNGKPVGDTPIPPAAGKEVFKPYSKYVKIKEPLPTTWDRKRIDTAEVVVFDLETTGLSAKPDFKKPNETLDDIIEISAIKYKKGVGGKKFYRLVKPFKPISAEVEKLTGITNEMIQKDGVDPRQALKDFAKFIGKDALRVGHNSRMFDNRMLRAVALRLGLPELKERFSYDTIIDTMEVAAKLFPESKWKPQYKNNPLQPNDQRPVNLKLNTVAEFFGIQNPGAHRAENDVITAAQLYYRLVDELRKRGNKLKTFGDFFKFQFSERSVPVEFLPDGHPQKK